MWLKKDKQAKDQYAQASRRIQNELDIVKFLRNRLIDNVHRRLIFTQGERFLMRHQAYPFLLRLRESGSDSDSHKKDNINVHSKYLDRLIQGTKN